MRLTTYDGLSLCSQRDPFKEAERWCSDIPRFDRLVVLGLGLGYHVDALAAKYPASQIHVLDHRKTLIDSYSSQSKASNIIVQIFGLDRIEFLNSFGADGHYRYAKIFYPCIQDKYLQYKELQKRLLARNTSGFEARARQSGIDCINWDKIKNFDEVNIKVIGECKFSTAKTHSARLITVLRELVK